MMRSTTCQPVRPAWMRWLAAAFLLAFVVSSALAGLSYVWCIPLGHARLACCCPPAAAQDEASPATDDGEPRFTGAPCCEARRVDALAASEAPRDALAGVAAPAAVLLPLPVLEVAAPVHAVPLVVAAPPVPESRGPPPVPLYKRYSRFLC